MTRKTQLRKYSPRRVRSSKLPMRWLMIAAIVIIGAIAIFVVISKLNTSVAPLVKGSPRIAIVKDSYDYGNVPFGKMVNTVFIVRNIGDQPLVILNQPQVKVVEGCCPPNAILSTSVIQPGQEASLAISFTMHDGMGGKHRFSIDLQTNDPFEPLKQLVVLSNWG